MRTWIFRNSAWCMTTLEITVAAALLTLAVVEVGAAPQKVAFRLDPRVTYGLYMGDRWVTPATFTQVGQVRKDLVVQAKSHDPVSWGSGDASIATVTPNAGRQVAITVRRAGQTTVTAGSVALNVKAELVDNGVLKVQITQ